VKLIRWLAAPAWAALLLGGGLVLAAGPEKKPPREVASFGTLRSLDPEAARGQALAWLKGVGKTDAATQKAFTDVWNSDRPLLDKVADTLALGDPEARKLLAEARDPEGPAPTDTPTLLKDPKRPAYFRHNLALAYAKALSSRKIYEETLDALKLVKPEDVVDPSSYLFHRAVAEHSLMLKEQAEDSIDRLLVDVLDAPERYRMVGALMHFDMLTWREKDLGWISRKMDNIHRRLDLARGGNKTKREQKEVVLRLEEMIKEIENKQKTGGS